MDAFFTILTLTAIASLADPVQLFAAAQAMRFARRLWLVMLAITLATLANTILSAYGGVIIRQWISRDALLMLYALSLGFAGFGMIFRSKPVDTLQKWSDNAFWTPLAGFFILQLGDKSQFMIATTAARTDNPLMAALGGSLGIMAIVMVGMLFHEELTQFKHLRLVRSALGVILVLAALLLGLSARGLI